MIAGAAEGAAAAAVPEAYRPKAMTKLPRTAVILKAWQYIRNAVPGSKTARAYLESRRLDYKTMEARGWRSGTRAGRSTTAPELKST